MAEREDKGAGTDQSSAHPKDWPGIPGRSAEHEANPDAPTREARSGDVTEQQRRLEREQRNVERK